MSQADMSTASEPKSEMSVRRPGVSIGIPFFNAAPTLLDAVRSVFAQTYSNWELILLDDGSTDGSLELARSIDDPRVRVYSDGKNRRLAARLNELVRLSKFEFIARMDADDLMSRVRLERQMAVLMADPAASLVTTGVCSLGAGDEPLGLRCVPDSHELVPYNLLVGKGGIIHGSIVGRKAWFLRNPYDEGLPRSQDTNLWIRAFSKGDLDVRFISQPLYFYREDGNVTSEKLLLSYRLGRRMILADARGFSLADRARAWVSMAGKSLAVRTLAAIGRFDVLRGRRIVQELSADQRRAIGEEIAAIRAYPLPQRS